ncbi:MAG: Rrf2 family transcriptional regulator [Spirochaetales bacterium]|jgi:Rrf2 family protein|nr:Rrf2 family transcriptional regulator [Spirochaetales bacterium]
MRISTKGRYSLEALLYLSLLPPGEYTSTRAIAEHTGISDGYLEQLFIPLKKAGIIHAIRGPQGGYLPGRSLKKITVGDILRAAEGPLEPVACVNSEKCPNEAWCVSRHTWSELYQEITACVDTLSLADLVDSYHELDGPEYVI